MADAEYRRELELELERLTRELADVRVEKAQQRQRIEQLQLEQSQLQDQLGQKTAGDKEMRTELAQKLHTLHQVVRQKKSEHSKVKREWERSQEQYNHLKQTVGVLQGSAVSSLIQDDDNSLQGDDLDSKAAQSHDVVQSLMGSMLIENSTLMSNLADEAVASRSDEASFCDTLDNDTVITEHTKDSLQVHRNKQLRKKNNGNGDADNDGGGGLSRFFSKQEGQVSLPSPAASSGNRNKLGSFLESDGKKTSKSVEKDLRSANE
jgi:chromosome segregation ATPase